MILVNRNSRKQKGLHKSLGGEALSSCVVRVVQLWWSLGPKIMLCTRGLFQPVVVILF
jgi:hypothetical protein